MKKIATTLICCLIATTVLASNPHKRQVNGLDVARNFRPVENAFMGKSAYQYRMTGYATDDNYERSVFYYNETDQIVACYEELTGEYQVYDSVRYNAAGQMIGIDGYQLLDNQWQEVYRVNYTFNTAGLIASRTNYNYMNNQWIEGGVYTYTYNAQGLISESQLTMTGTLSSRIIYEYTNGKLLRETYYEDNGTGTLSNSMKRTYIYTSNRLSQITDSLYDNNAWVYDGKSEYFYDANGNCTEFRKSDGNNHVTGRSLYEYESRLVENTLIPYTPELTRPEMYTNMNLYTVEHWYTLDIDNVLQYVCDYEYEYSGTTGICCTASNVPSVKVYPNPTSQRLNIEGMDETSSQIEIYDLSGRKVATHKVNNSAAQIAISALPSGVYTLRVEGKRGLQIATFTVAR